MPANTLTPAEVLARVGQNQIKFIELGGSKTTVEFEK